MMYASKIKMKRSCQYSNNLLEIDEIYITGCDNPGFFPKEILYDHLINHPGSIKVNIFPYPLLIPAKSVNNEKYVKSESNSTTRDNLLNLDRV